MNTFPFVDKAGKEYEVICEVGEAQDLPPIDGQFHKFLGKQLKRIPPDLQGPLGVKERHFVSRSLPFNYRYHAEMGGTFDSEGRCQFDSWTQLEKTTKHANHHGEGLVYDDAKEIQ